MIAALAEAEGEGEHAGTHRAGRHENGAEARSRGGEGGGGGIGGAAAVAVGEGDEENGVGDGDADGHDRADRGLEIEGGASELQREDDAGEYAGDGGDHDEGEAEGLEVRGEEQKDDGDGDEEAGAKTLGEFSERTDLAAVVDAAFGGRFAEFGDGGGDLAGGGAEVDVVEIGGDADDTDEIVAFVLAGGGAGCEAGDITQEDGLAAGCGRRDRDVAEVFEGVGLRLGNLDLEAHADTAAGVGPVVGGCETAGGCRGDEGTRDIARADTEEAGAFAVDLDVDGGEIERLGDVDVAEIRKCAEFGGDFFGKLAARGERRPADGDLDGGGRAEAHDARDEITRLEGDADSGELGGEGGAEFFFEGFDLHARAGLELHGEPALLGAGVEKVDEIDGIIGGVNADEADGDGDVGGAGFAVDGVEDLFRDGFGFFDLGAGGTAETDGELAGIDGGENLEPELRAENGDEAEGGGEVEREDEPAGGDERTDE